MGMRTYTVASACMCTCSFAIGGRVPRPASPDITRGGAGRISSTSSLLPIALVRTSLWRRGEGLLDQLPAALPSKALVRVCPGRRGGVSSTSSPPHPLGLQHLRPPGAQARGGPGQHVRGGRAPHSATHGRGSPRMRVGSDEPTVGGSAMLCREPLCRPQPFHNFTPPLG